MRSKAFNFSLVIAISYIISLNIFSQNESVAFQKGPIMVPLGSFLDALGKEFTLSVFNPGATDLEITKIMPDCSCVAISDRSIFIPPGEQYELKAAIRPELVEVAENFVRSVVLTTTHGDIVYKITGARHPAIKVDRDQVHFAEFSVSPEKQAPQRVYFTACDNKHANMLEYVGVDPRFQVVLSRISSTQTEATISLSKTFIAEMEPFDVELPFKLKGVSLYTIFIRVSGDVFRQSQVSETHINLGVIAVGTQYQRNISIYNTNLGSDFTATVVENDGVQTHISNNLQGVFNIKISGIICGKEGQSYKKTLRLKTNDPSAEIIPIRIIAAIPKTKCCN